MKKQIQKLALFAAVFLGGVLILQAQIPTVHYEEDQAISYIFSEEEATVFELPVVDVGAYQQEDIELDAGNNPFRFGAPIAVGFNITEMTNVIYAEGYRVWKTAIYGEGAKSINLVFENLELPDTAVLYIYDESGRTVQGPIVQKMIPEGGRFGTTIMAGSKVIIECAQPITAVNRPSLNVTKAVYGYREFWGSDGSYGASSGCNNDVRCALGNDWCVEQRAVTRLLINDNAFCTGAAINNADSDLNQAYVLTANHCLGSNTNNWQFEFHYKNPYCGANSYSGITWGFTGATLRANWVGTDFALLELNGYNPNNNMHRLAGVHFAGWSRSANNSAEATGIHHPRGDVMKISRDNNGAVAANWPGTPANSHWQVHFNSGTVEHGSSGSPLFDQNHRIVGQLHGNLNYYGQPYCDTPDGWYGRLNVAWNGGGTAATRLSDWLGPVTGNTVDATAATVIYHNEQISGNAGLHTAMQDMELEGNVNGYPPPFPWGNPIFPVNNQSFVAYNNANVAYKAGETIAILPGVHFDLGSSMHAYIEPVNCSDGLDYGYSTEIGEQIVDRQEENSLNEVSSANEPGIELKIYPNPATDMVNLQFAGTGEGDLKILNSQGQIVYRQGRVYLDETTLTINVSNLPSGLYTVMVDLYNGNLLSRRFVKSR